MNRNSTLLALLRDARWGEDQSLIDDFKQWEHYPIFLETLENLNLSSLFESKIHGVGHIERTILHGALAARSEGLSAEDTRLLLLACSYHDVGRLDDGPDDLHGYRAAQQLERLTHCHGEELRLMQGAVDAHSRNDRALKDTVRGYHCSDQNRALTIATLLKDADGLDRVRIWDLDPRFLRREASRQRADFAQRLYLRYQAAVGAPAVPWFVRKWKNLDENGNPL